MYIKNYSNWMALYEAASNELVNLVKKARENDSDLVKSNPVYNSVMSWMERGGPEEGKTTMKEETLIKQMRYWNGDLSSKVSVSSSGKNVELALAELLNDKNLEKLISNAGKAAGRAGSYGAKMDRDLIKGSVEMLISEFKSLHKIGRKFGGKNEDGYNWKMSSHSKKDAPSIFLGIIPFIATAENIKKEYQGKDLTSSDAKRFENWYNSLKDGGIDKLIGYLKDRRYTRAVAVMMSDIDKNEILKGYSDKANKTKNDISNAIKISWRQSGVKQDEETTVTETPGEPVIIKSGPVFFPSSEKVAKTFFRDDKADLTPGYENSIKNAIVEMKNSIPDGAEITKLEFTTIASTSVVPSDFNGDGKWTTQENESLVKARAAKVSELARVGFEAAGIADKAIEIPAKLIPNNNGGGESAEWGNNQRAKYSPAKRKSDPAVLAAYEETYGQYRYSGVIIELEYKLTTPTTDTEETFKENVTGKWTSYITWYKQSTRNKIKPKFRKIKMPNFNMRKSTGKSFIGANVKDMCAAYK